MRDLPHEGPAYIKKVGYQYLREWACVPGTKSQAFEAVADHNVL